MEGEGRVSECGMCGDVYECVKESGQTLHKFQIGPCKLYTNYYIIFVAYIRLRAVC